MLPQGSVSPRPTRKKSQAHPGVHPVSPFTHRTQRFQPLPAPLGDPPYHFKLEDAVQGIQQKNRIVFHTVGDTGGIKNADYQHSVATAMKGDLNKSPDMRPDFFYHLGDVIYYNGEYQEYRNQFYEPYDHYDPPIFSIPGNHDGEPIDASQTSLDGWVAFFMTASPHIDPVSADAPRVTMSLPNVYFTLECPCVTIIGLYTNVPEGGSVDSVQLQWLAYELSTAPKDKALVVSLHHPIYSFDDHHSGSPRMADVLQQAINDSRRAPNMVLTAHVHNYQRIERDVVAGTKIPFLVAGHGGYYHLHGLNASVGDSDASTGAKLIAADDKQHGYVTLSVDKNKITGTMTAINKVDNTPVPDADKFEYSTAAINLGAGQTVSL